MTRELLDRLRGLHSRLRRGRAVNVNDRQTKDEVIALGSAYFSSCRNALVDVLGESDALLANDQKWQDLIRLAHGNNARKSYLKMLHDLERQIAEFNVASLSRTFECATGGRGLSDLTPAEALIHRTLESAVPSAAASYRQGVLDLRTERLSYRGTAAELREALRETLDHLAPDGDVMAQASFSLEPEQSKPTMKQKAQYILGSAEEPRQSERRLKSRSN